MGASTPKGQPLPRNTTDERLRINFYAPKSLVEAFQGLCDEERKTMTQKLVELMALAVARVA